MIKGQAARTCSPETVDSVRETLDVLLQQAGIGYAAAARLLGRNPAYVQQFIRRGVPRRLPERDRRLLAQHLGVSESWLGAPPIPLRPDPGQHAMDPSATGSPTVRIPWLEPGGHSRAPLALDRAATLHLTGGRPAALAAHEAVGDTMLPTIASGDQLLIDRDDAAEPRDGLYVLRIGSHLCVRRIALLPPSGHLAIRCDNPAYGVEERADPGQLAILGRIVWIGRFLP